MMSEPELKPELKQPAIIYALILIYIGKDLSKLTLKYVDTYVKEGRLYSMKKGEEHPSDDVEAWLRRVSFSDIRVFLIDYFSNKRSGPLMYVRNLQMEPFLKEVLVPGLIKLNLLSQLCAFLDLVSKDF